MGDSEIKDWAKNTNKSTDNQKFKNKLTSQPKISNEMIKNNFKSWEKGKEENTQIVDMKDIKFLVRVRTFFKIFKRKVMTGLYYLEN